jgi:hypothetical protein
MKQHASSAPKSVTLRLPSLPRPHFKKPSFKGGKSSIAILVLLVVAIGVGGGLGYKKYTALREEDQRLSNPQAAAEDEANRIKDEVAQLIELPNEKPTVATVVDVEKLKSQAFFANAQNGDRVLLFAQSKKAVLYRPGTKKIVEVAPINIGDNGVAGANTTTPTPVAPTTTPKTTTPVKR